MCLNFLSYRFSYSVHVYVYCKTFYICGVNFPFNEYDILAEINFGVHDIPWFYCPDKTSKFDVNFKQICHIFFNFSVKLSIVASLRITSSRQF